jgi:hypothetical protein
VALVWFQVVYLQGKISSFASRSQKLADLAARWADAENPDLA